MQCFLVKKKAFYLDVWFEYWCMILVGAEIAIRHSYNEQCKKGPVC